MPINKKKIEKKIINKEIRKQMITFVTGAFSFIAALVWRDTIMEFMKPILDRREGPFAMVLVAVLVTLIAANIIYFMNKTIK